MPTTDRDANRIGPGLLRPTRTDRWALAGSAGAIAAFFLFVAVMNVRDEAILDAGYFAGVAAFFAYVTWLPWSRFVEATEDGLRYRNWGPARSVPWADIERFGMRPLFNAQPPTRWAVVVYRRDHSPISLRGATRARRYIEGVNQSKAFAGAVSDELEQARAARVGTARLG
jgi:hypothetical protein